MLERLEHAATFVLGVGLVASAEAWALSQLLERNTDVAIFLDLVFIAFLL